MTSPIQVPEAPLAVLDLYPIYESADEYEKATGKPAPSLDTTKARKTWCDPDALTAPNGMTASGVLYTTSDGVYPTLSVIQKDGKYVPVTDVLVMDRTTASKVNLPRQGVEVGKSNYTELPVVPTPRRNIVAGEEIRMAVGGGLMPVGEVVNVALEAEAKQQADIAAGKFLPADRSLLQAIAAKVGASAS